MKIYGFMILLVFAFMPFAQGKDFTNQYCEFQLPNGWECALEGSEWVCQHANAERRKEAIIILAAKIRGPQDSLEEYETYLKKTKTFELPGGSTQYSDAKYTKKSTIFNHLWIDSLHLASEVPGFYTRYLATVKEDLGVAVTFSVAKKYYNDYKDLFDNIVATLKVFRAKQGLDADSWKPTKADADLIGKLNDIDGADAVVDIGSRQHARRRGSADVIGTSSLLILLVAGGLIAAIIIRKKKLKGKRKGRK